MHESLDDPDAPGDEAAAPDRVADDDRPAARWARAWSAKEPLERAATALDVAVVTAAVLFVLLQLGPGLLIADTTPAGGDMGAHVWGPAYLRDNLLPSGRLAGWAPDWYAGFPAYHFYMVVPALAIVALDAGITGWGALVPAALAAGLLAVSFRHPNRLARRAACVAGVAVAVLGIGLPYGVAFKFVAVAGLLALPVACYVAVRLADLPFPSPAIAATASVVFLFNKEPVSNGTGNIIGGNVASTLAGEFSFSISLAFCVLYIGFLLRGLRTGRHAATCAVLLALTAVCHVIPAIYAMGATAVAVLVSLPLDRAKLRWLLPIGPVAVGLSAFWTGPFLLRRAYLNDMGWEKLPGRCAENASNCLGYGDFLWPGGLRWVFALAVVGFVVSALLRIRLGILLGLCGIATAVAFRYTPQGRLWNARLLPFFILCLCLLAGIAIAELARAVASLVALRPERPVSGVTFGAPIGAALAVYIVVGLPLGVLPGSTRASDGDIRWGPLTIQEESRFVVRDWARWNFSGYERKAAYPEYHGLVEMAKRIAESPELGCGRVMWEYENDRLNRYGTPMAPMLLPFWTDGCMGSMEGLYFEASTSTPYHFLNQRALSAKCSCAQRDLPYGGAFDIELGIDQLQVMGVRYYFAFSPTAVTEADAHPDLVEVDSSGPWHAYLVSDTELVAPLAAEPVVLTGLEPGMSWVGPASRWFQDPKRYDVPFAADGPPEWSRVAVCSRASGVAAGPDGPAAPPLPPGKPAWTQLDLCDTAPAAVPLPPTTVTGIEAGTNRIAFDVSEVGVPVVVRASYFPNWKATGADGPYRLSPNLMVVIPTQNHVELDYGWTPVDAGAYAMTLLAIGGTVWLARRRIVQPGPVWLDGPDPIVPAPPAEPSEPEHAPVTPPYEAGELPPDEPPADPGSTFRPPTGA